MKREAFTQTRFILCEGFENSALVRALTDFPPRKLSRCDVSPNNDVGSVSGNTGFEKAIIGAEIIRGFEKSQHVVVVADNDDDPIRSFNQVNEQLKKAKDEGNIKRDWAIPTQPGVRTAGDPSVTIWMWPSIGQPGCLESLLWKIIEAEYQSTSLCVEAALQCSGAHSWPISKLDKARVRCFMSIYCRINPALALGYAWRDVPDLFPLNHKEFDEFVKVLSDG